MPRHLFIRTTHIAGTAICGLLRCQLRGFVILAARPPPRVRIERAYISDRFLFWQASMIHALLFRRLTQRSSMKQSDDKTSIFQPLGELNSIK